MIKRALYGMILFFVCSIVYAEVNFNIRYVPDSDDGLIHRQERLYGAGVFSDGSYVVAGVYDICGKFPICPDNDYGYLSGVVAKYDVNDNKEWEIITDENPILNTRYNIGDLILTEDEDIVLSSTYMILKLDKDGNEIFKKTFDDTGNVYDFGEIVVDKEENIYTHDFKYLYKLSANGDILKQVSISTFFDEMIYTSDGHILTISDTYNAANSAWYVSLIKYDKDLNVVWDFHYKKDFVSSSCTSNSVIEIDHKYYFFGETQNVDFDNKSADEYEKGGVFYYC